MSENQKIKEAVERAVKTVALRPERGQRTYRNVARLREGLLCRVEEGEHALVVDGIKALGGDNAGPSPVTLLRTALSSCIAMGIKQWAARADIQVDAIDVNVETDVDARGELGVSPHVPVGFKAVRVEVRVSSSAPRSAINDVISRSMTHSPLMHVFNAPIEVERHFSVISTEAA